MLALAFKYTKKAFWSIDTCQLYWQSSHWFHQVMSWKEQAILDRLCANVSLNRVQHIWSINVFHMQICAQSIDKTLRLLLSDFDEEDIHRRDIQPSILVFPVIPRVQSRLFYANMLTCNPPMMLLLAQQPAFRRCSNVLKSKWTRGSTASIHQKIPNPPIPSSSNIYCR